MKLFISKTLLVSDFGEGATLAAVQLNYFLEVKLLFLAAELTFALPTSPTIQLSLTLHCTDTMADVFQVFFHCDACL